MPRYYPAFIDVRGRECVVFGGGPLGEEKVAKLLECGARVRVIAPEVEETVAGLAEAGKVEWLRREYRSGDLAGAFIAISAAEDDFTDRRIHAEAERRNVLLNVVDVTHLCTFIAPSVARRGEVTVATSTGGASPALARTFREKLEANRILEFADLAPTLSRARAELRRQNLRVAPDDWQACITEELLDTVQQGNSEAAYKLLLDGLMATAVPMS